MTTTMECTIKMTIVPSGEMSWISSNSTDYDSDGCRDLTEDFDDDNDGKEDAIDDCLLGDLGWISTLY